MKTNDDRESAASGPRSVLRRFRSIFFRALLVIWPLALIETAVEWLDVAPARPVPIEIWNTQQDEDLESPSGSFREDRRWLWEPRPGAVFEGDLVNEDCQRGRRTPKERGDALRIVTLGDSSTFGLGVRDEECFSRRLEALLKERGTPAEVVNLGCIGYSAAQAVALYEGKGVQWKPDIVIVAVGAVNEHWAAPGDLSDRKKIALLSQPARRVLRWVERYSSVRGLEALFSNTAPAEVDATPGAIAPLPSLRRVSVDEFESLIEELAKETERNGAKLLVVIPPRRGDAEFGIPTLVEYSNRLRKVVARLGLPSVDVLDEFRRRDLADPALVIDPRGSKLFVDSYHPSKEGHALYSQLLLEAIERLHWNRRGAAR